MKQIQLRVASMMNCFNFPPQLPIRLKPFLVIHPLSESLLRNLISCHDNLGEVYWPNDFHNDKNTREGRTSRSHPSIFFTVCLLGLRLKHRPEVISGHSVVKLVNSNNFNEVSPNFINEIFFFKNVSRKLLPL